MRSEELLVKQEKRHADRMHDGRSKNLAYVCVIKEIDKREHPKVGSDISFKPSVHRNRLMAPNT